MQSEVWRLLEQQSLLAWQNETFSGKSRFSFFAIRFLAKSTAACRISRCVCRRTFENMNPFSKRFGTQSFPPYSNLMTTSIFIFLYVWGIQFFVQTKLIASTRLRTRKLETGWWFQTLRTNFSQPICLVDFAFTKTSLSLLILRYHM